MCYECYGREVETITHRELRNNSATVLARVASGESFTVTNHGKPVAVLTPVTETDPEMRVSRPRKRVGGWSEITPVKVDGPSVQEILDDLRGGPYEP